MPLLAVLFGAGKIGRGFFGDLLNKSGFELVFVEARLELVESLNRQRAYSIQWVEGDRHEIRGVRALHIADQDSIADLVARAEVVCTAVGINALTEVARPLAFGIVRRDRSGGCPKPLNILIGENDEGAHRTLRKAVASHLTLESPLEPLLQQTGFVRCVISRMVFEELPGDPPIPRAERYPYLPVDADSLVGEPPPIQGLQPVRPFEAHIRRKLYLHNGLHALLAYIGFQKGYTYIHEAMADPEIHRLVADAAHSLERAFLATYPFDPGEYRAVAQDLLARFADPCLQDPIRRVARDPLRKLRAGDRLAGAVRFLQAAGEDATPFLQAIQAALHYRDPENPASLELGAWLDQAGETEVLKTLCGLEESR